ncbi:hypothetical protein, variant, partial [Puccinia triticina 1-1 BBBD Race 1]
MSQPASPGTSQCHQQHQPQPAPPSQPASHPPTMLQSPFARTSAQDHHHQQPAIEAGCIDDESEDEGEAIADALLGRRTHARLSIGKHIDSSPSRTSCLEEGQLREDEESQSQAKAPTQQDHSASSSSVPQQPPSSLLDRLGPPSQSASLASSSSPQDDRPRRTHIHGPHEEAKIQPSRPPRAHRQHPAPHSPKRSRNSRSRSPINRQPPLSATEQRRTSLSSRITLSNRHHSCSPIALQFDVQSRCQQIARRFSSPSNSTPVRRDPREQREQQPAAPHYEPNTPNYNSHRPHHHHPPPYPHNGPPGSQSKASNSNAIALPTSKSPSLKNASLRVSILIENLPPYSALTPRRLFEHLVNLIPPTQRPDPGLPSALKLYRYARSDCVCAELRFNALAHARYFVQRTPRAWPSIWYTASKIPPDSRKKSMEFTLLEGDKPVTWPSRYETYYPKFKSDTYRPHTRTVEEDTTTPTPEKETSPSSSQTRHAPVPEFGRRKAAQTNQLSAPSTSKPSKSSNALTAKSHHSDHYRPKGRPHEDHDAAPARKKSRPPALKAPSPEDSHELIKNELIKNEISILLSQSSNTTTTKPPKDTNLPVLNDPPKHTKHSPQKTNLQPVDHPTNGALVKASQGAPAPSSTRADDQHKPPFTSIINVSVAGSGPGSKIPGLNVGTAHQGNPSPALTLHSVSSKSPESADTKYPHPVFTLESLHGEPKERTNGVLLSKMLPSITLSVLQSHFLIPNRPRDFRIFEPLQICYGPFFNPAPLDQSISSTTGSQADLSLSHQLEMGCLISFSDPNTAAHFCRVLELNSPFHPLHIRLVDPAHIQFLPSASTISNPPKQQQQGYLDPSGTCYGPMSPFFSNAGFLNWPTVQQEMMQSGSPLGLGPMGQLAEPRTPSGPLQHHQSADMGYNNNNNNAYPYLNDYSSGLLGHHMSSLPSPSHLSFTNSLSYNHSPYSLPPPPQAVSDPSQDLSTLLSSSSPSHPFSTHPLPPIPPPQSLTALHRPPSSSLHTAQDFSPAQTLPPLPRCNPQPSPPPPPPPASASASTHDLPVACSSEGPLSASTSVDSLEILTCLPTNNNPSSFDPYPHQPHSSSNTHFNGHPSTPHSTTYFNPNPRKSPFLVPSSTPTNPTPAPANNTTVLGPPPAAENAPPPGRASGSPVPASQPIVSAPSSSAPSNTQLEHLQRLKNILKARKAVGP